MNNKGTNALEICPQCRKQVRPDRIASHLTLRCEKRPASCTFSDIFPRRPVPAWITQAVSTASTRFPLMEILRESCFYPASGLDASPVIIANGFVHSFIYADYGIKKDAYIKAINQTGFRGYSCVLNRDIIKDEIVPPAWTPRMPTAFDEWNGFNRLMEAQSKCEPFGHWTIWQRLDDFDDRIGPSLFSFFFLAGEGVATYQGLYDRYRTVPTILAIIQPGHAFGFNWTNFFDPRAPFWQAVESGDNTPDYLLVGNAGSLPPTDDYQSPYAGYHFVRRTTIFQPELVSWREDCSILMKILAESRGDSPPASPSYLTHHQWRMAVSHTIDIFKQSKT